MPMPLELVNEQLTANQKRARFVAKDVTECASKAPFGWVMRPKNLSDGPERGLRHGSLPNVCSRVCEILADLGEEKVTIQDSRGDRKLVFLIDEFVRM
jgi:hypothetical protein